MPTRKALLRALAALAYLVIPLGIQGQEAPWRDGVTDRSTIEAGRRLYLRKCVFCHGSGGRGDGSVARYVSPRPRDLTTGWFKIRSTPTGGMPTDEDLFMTLSRGLPGTTMPAWANLSTMQRWQLVSYIKTFSDGFEEVVALELQPITIGTPKPPYPESVASGQRLFIDVQCWDCHGMQGRGDGPSSHTLVDDWDYPITPADLTVSRNWRGGHRPEDVFRSIAVGIGGTPMPSFDDALTDDQLWDLVNYLLWNIGT